MSTSAKQQAWRQFPRTSVRLYANRIAWLTLGTNASFTEATAPQALRVRPDRQICARDRPGTVRVRVRTYRSRRSTGQHLDRRRGGPHRRQVQPARQGQIVLGRTPEYMPMPNMDRVDSMGTVPSRRGRSASASRATSSTRRPSCMGHAGQHLRRGWSRRLAHREVRLERKVSQVVGVSGDRTRPIRRSALARDRCARERVCRGSRRPAHPGVRQQRRVKTQFIMPARRGRCASRRFPPILYTSNSNGPREFDKGGAIYKMELDGRVIGRFGRAGPLIGSSARCTESMQK